MLARAFPMFKEVNGEADRFGVVVASEKRMKRIYGWVRSFNIRHNYAPRRPTHVAQNPNVQEREIDDFVSLVRRYAERYVIRLIVPPSDRKVLRRGIKLLDNNSLVLQAIPMIRRKTVGSCDKANITSILLSIPAKLCSSNSLFHSNSKPFRDLYWPQN